MITPELERQLAAHGIDLRSLLACLEKECRRSDGSLGGEQPYVPGAPDAIPGVSLTTAHLSTALRLLQQQSAGAPAHFAELPKAEPLPKVELPPDQRAVPRPFTKPPQHKPESK